MGATALRLAKDFSGLVLAARNGEALKEVAAEVKSSGADPLAFALDLSIRESAETLIKGTLDRFGRIDALLNIAGAVPQIDLFEMTDEQWLAGLELKFHGARRLTILAWEALKASKGSVVLISGSAALDPNLVLLQSPRSMRPSSRLRRLLPNRASRMVYKSIVLYRAR